ncbi:TonB-dependent receptor [Maribellus sediminis]|uniref:TonB-dependent receptor n=1 Tax=Maribellus sediminis TaxID=2696285 RepID=UPI0014310B5B|nr:Plug domain-containing protein [Maribellus sediminis]
MKLINLLPILLITLSLNLFAQNENTLKHESESVPPFQKLYLHTDHEFYFYGDTIWFAAYLLHPQTHQPVKTDCNLYVELADSSANIVHQELFPIHQGFCPGQLSLNDPNLKEGNFLIRAYTDLLGAYGDDMNFSKPISIARVKNKVLYEQHQNRITKVSIDLFPEGGFLLADTYNQMAFTATDGAGRRIDIRGKLMNRAGEELLKFASLYDGMGIIHFVPEQKETYTLEIDGYPNVEYNFPEIMNSGVKLMVTRQNKNGVELVINSNNREENGTYSVAAMHRGILTSYTDVGSCETEKTVSIKNELLKTGINRIIVLDQNLVPLSERLVFIDNSDCAALDISLNNSHFVPREEVEIEVIGNKKISLQEQVNLSVTVIDESSFPTTGVTQNIKSYLLLDSELRGYIANPAGYFIDEPTVSSAQKLNLLMLTHGWSNYIWNSLAEKEKTPDFETRLGLTLSGTLKNYYQSKRLNDGNVMLSVSSSENKFMQFTPSDSLGRYTFKNVQFYDSATVIVQGTNRKNKTNTTVTLNNFQFASPGITPAEITMMRNLSDMPVSLLQRKYENDLELKEFFPDRYAHLIGEINVIADKPKEENKGRIQIYSEPTYTIEMVDNAYAYPDIIEYLKGRVPGGFGGIYLIDGIEITGIDSMFNPVTSIPMEMIERVEILKRAQAAIFGMQGAHGAVNIILKRGGEYAPSPNTLKGTLARRIQGFSSYREFYSPKYTSENIHSEIPDKRTTLYWNPSVSLNHGKASISFFTCDNISDYKIYIEGISENGTICLGEAEFTVNEKDRNSNDF